MLIAQNKTFVHGKILGGDIINDPQSVYLAYSVGEEVEVGGERFFVIEDSDENNSMVKLLAKYCLNQTGTAQQNAGVGRQFSSSNYWSDDVGTTVNVVLNLQSTSMVTKARMDNTWDVNGTTVINAIISSQEYGTAKGGAGRLMTYAEATTIGSNIDWMRGQGGDYYPVNSYLLWWLGSAGSERAVWTVDGRDGNMYYYRYTANDIGVRPVLEISKDRVTKLSGS